MKVLAKNGKPVALNGEMILPSSKQLQMKTVNLSMASGNQVIAPDEGYSLSEVTVVKPSTLIPENIKKNVDIGGVVGTMAYTPSGTGTSVDVRVNAITVDRYQCIAEERTATLDLSGLITGNYFICFFYAPGIQKVTGDRVILRITLECISYDFSSGETIGYGVVENANSSAANAVTITPYLDSDSDQGYDISDFLGLLDSEGNTLADCMLDAESVGKPISYVVSWD